jgi:hypothetical protein
VRIGGRKLAKRRGVSAVIAEVTLIAVTLISIMILSGIFYGSFDTYVPPAEVAAQSSSCSAQNGNEVCQLTLQNQSPHSVSTSTLCALTVQGSKLTGTVANGGTVPGSGTLSGVKCVVSGASAPPGAQLSGELALMNFATVFFTAVSN